MVTVEELKERFPVQNVQARGKCIIIPGNEFDPDWEADLEETIEDTIIDGQPVTLVLLDSKVEENDSSEGQEPPDKPKPKNLPRNLLANVWSVDDEKRLLKRMSEFSGSIESKCARLTKEFAGRSKDAIHQRYIKLQRKLKGPRKIGRPKGIVETEKRDKGEKKEQPALTSHGVPLNPQKTVQPPTSTPTMRVPIEAQAKEDPLLTLVREIRDRLPKMFTFDYHCRHCADCVGSAEDSKVWEFCPKCGRPLIIWNVREASR